MELPQIFNNMCVAFQRAGAGKDGSACMSDGLCPYGNHDCSRCLARHHGAWQCAAPQPHSDVLKWVSHIASQSETKAVIGCVPKAAAPSPVPPVVQPTASPPSKAAAQQPKGVVVPPPPPPAPAEAQSPEAREKARPSQPRASPRPPCSVDDAALADVADNLPVVQQAPVDGFGDRFEAPPQGIKGQGKGKNLGELIQEPFYAEEFKSIEDVPPGTCDNDSHDPGWQQRLADNPVERPSLDCSCTAHHVGEQAAQHGLPEPKYVTEEMLRDWMQQACFEVDPSGFPVPLKLTGTQPPPTGSNVLWSSAQLEGRSTKREWFSGRVVSAFFNGETGRRSYCAVVY